MTDRHETPDFDAYKILQVDPEADPEVIQAAFRRLAQKWHPDLAAGPEAAARMVALNRAWSLLGDADRRREYDRERAAHTRMDRERANPGPGAFAGAGDARRARPESARSTPPRPAPATGQRSRATPPPPEEVSRDWTSGRSGSGYTYEPSMRTADGEGAAGRPPGNPSGSVLNFGRYTGWSLGEISRSDLEYIEWLDRTPIGRPYREEIDAILRRAGRRRSATTETVERRGLFRRR